MLIAYQAELRWQKLTLRYASLLQLDGAVHVARLPGTVARGRAHLLGCARTPHLRYLGRS